MKIKIEKINKEINKEELNSLLNELPKWRLVKALSFRFDVDKYLCAKSFLILQEMLLQEYQIKDVPPFSYGKNHKPYFKEYPNIHFNLSHCKSGIACIIDNKPVGIDIEEINFDKDVAKSVLSKEEMEDVENSENKELEFTKYWTKKESYLKLTGDGLVDNMKNLLNECQDKIEFNIHIDNDFVVTSTIWKD